MVFNRPGFTGTGFTLIWGLAYFDLVCPETFLSTNYYI